MSAPAASKPPVWRVLLALGAVYLSWGTTFLAIKEGVKTLPPCLFSGTRIVSAGLVLFAFVLCSGRPGRLPRREIFRTWLHSLLLFVGGNGLITIGQKTVPSSEASILVATVPLWIGLLETLWPSGERLSLFGWCGLSMGLAGVAVLRSDKLGNPQALYGDMGTVLVLGSALSWAAGSVVLRYRRIQGDRLTLASYQMILGGLTLVLLGLAHGEGERFAIEQLTPQAVFAFFYLLCVGSLVGFLSYSWLLGHVSTTVAGTYAYVTPAVALLAGWLVGGEDLTGRMFAGMFVILTGVALVRSGEAARSAVAAVTPEETSGCPPLADTGGPVAEKV